MKTTLITGIISFLSIFVFGQKSSYNVMLNRQLSSSAADFAPRLIEDNSSSLIFTSTRKSATANIFYTTTKNNTYKKPIPLINSDKNDNFGVVTFDSKRKVMFYTKCPRFQTVSSKHCEIYYSFMQGKLIGESIVLNLFTDSIVGHPYFSNKQDVLFFVSSMPGGYGKMDIWFSRYDRETDSWGKPQNAGPEINTKEDEFYPFVALDGTLYFTSDGHKGFGGWDIFKAIQKEKLTWNSAQNMGEPINSNMDDFGIVFATSEKGYFSSNRSGGVGGDDIYDFAMDTSNLEPTIIDNSDPDETINTLLIVFNKESCDDNVESLKISEAKAFPNPNNGAFTFEFNCNKKVDLLLRIYSNLGQVVITETVELNKGHFSKQLNLHNAISGVYYIQVLYNCEPLYTEKIILNK